jgi:hypothetical protein
VVETQHRNATVSTRKAVVVFVIVVNELEGGQREAKDFFMSKINRPLLVISSIFFVWVG